MSILDQLPASSARPAPSEPEFLHPRRSGRVDRWLFRLPPAWPLALVLVCYPFWWAMGLVVFVYPIVAIPMAVHLCRRGTIRVPPGFGIWLMLITLVVLSVLMLDQTMPGTLPPTGGGRYLAATIRVAQYLSFTTVMLYVLSLDERVLSQLKVMRMLGVMCVLVVIGGYVGMLAPGFAFTAPLSHVLPGGIASDPYVKLLMNVQVAQVSDVLDEPGGAPRPSAPFEYTNFWGENLAILLVWMTVGWVILGKGLIRVAGILVAVAATVPLIYSLNRGAWVGIGIVVTYTAVRMALRGKFIPLAGIMTGAVVFALLIILSPLGTIFDERLANGHSDEIREILSSAAIDAGMSSPVIGYGGNRALIGSGRSIAIGKSAECPQCGNREIGSNGMLWHLLVSQGLAGAALYNGFFLWNLWRFRRDHTAIGIAASSVMLLMLFFQTAYGAYESALAYALISIALVARNETRRRQQGTTPAEGHRRSARATALAGVRV